MLFLFLKNYLYLLKNKKYIYLYIHFFSVLLFIPLNSNIRFNFFFETYPSLSLLIHPKICPFSKIIVSIIGTFKFNLAFCFEFI